MARRKQAGRIDFSSDGTFGHSSEVLWSRPCDEFFSDDNYGFRNSSRASDSEETLSSSSWGFANYEKQSVEKISSYLDAIDEALYEGNFSPLSQELKSECQKWREAYPHLRLKGKQVFSQSECSQNPAPLADDGHHSEEKHSLQKHTRESSGAAKYILSRNFVDDGAGDYLFSESACDAEEVIAKDGIYEETDTSCTRVDVPRSCEEPDYEKDNRSSFSTYYVKDKIIEQLAAVVWRNVISACKNNSETDGSRESEHLPPIDISHGSIGLPPLQNFKARGWSTLASDFPVLDGILKVSPKILLPKNERPLTRMGILSRPSTGWSSQSRSTSASSQNSSLHRNSRESPKDRHNGLLERSDTKVTEKDLELIRMYLPTVEEDNPILRNGLQGLHIEPELKRCTKLLSMDIAHSVAKPQSFLPPIDDRESITPHNKDFRSLVYEPYTKKDRNQNNCSIYARHLNRTGSRPGTSQTEDMNASDFSRMKRPESNMSSKHNEVKPSYPTASSGHNLVNLLPIVTSLEPKQVMKRKMTAQRKSILSSIPKEKH